MRRSFRVLGWALCAMVPLLGMTGCSNTGLTTAGLSGGGMNGVSTPPIHVNLSRSGAEYMPSQIRHAYGFDQLATTGAGQTIAIVDAYGSPTITADLAHFSTQFGLPTAALTLAYPAGKPTTTDPGWAMETSLDVEWAHAIAPSARILLVVSPSANNNNLLACVDYAAQNAAQVSMSWGGQEFNGESSLDYHFNRPGVTFFASSGDSGAGVNWPAVSPYVVGVGGTTLTLTSANTRSTETAWSGSGGGQSAYVPEPSFQQVWQTSGKRQVPDVSYNANPNTGFLVYDGTPYSGYSGWFLVGGTSAGAPQWAAICALANAGRGGKLAGNTPLYSLGSPSNYLTNYVDITVGSDGHAAGKGYDMVTGIGAPIGNSLVPKLTTF